MRRLFVLGVLAALAIPALAQEPQHKSEGTFYLGYMRGDAALDVANSPTLDDDFAVGVQWARAFTPTWGFLWRVGYSPNQITDLSGEDVGADLIYTDFSATYQANFQNVSLYVPVGVGYAKASFDRPLRAPTCPGSTCVEVDGDSGLTYHVGLGMKFPWGKNKLWTVEGRYRILDSITDSLDARMDTFELSVGFGWAY